MITSQFIINLTDNPQFDDAGGTTVFARILGDGLDIVDAIATLPAISLGAEGLELVPVIGPEVPAINSVRVNILDAYIYDGTAEEYLAEFGGSGGNGGEDGDDNGGKHLHLAKARYSIKMPSVSIPMSVNSVCRC